MNGNRIVIKSLLVCCSCGLMVFGVVWIPKAMMPRKTPPRVVRFDGPVYEIGNAKIQMLADGSVTIQVFNEGNLDRELTIPSEKIGSDRPFLMGIYHGGKYLQVWRILRCSVSHQPERYVYAAWNSQTDEILMSPGYTVTLLQGEVGHAALVTVDCAPSESPVDTPDTLYVNGIALGALGDYSWKVEEVDGDRVDLEAKTSRGRPVRARLTRCGTWTSVTGKDYEVYHVYAEIEMLTEHSNVRGVSRVYFVREGEVVVETSTAGVITVQDGELFVEDRGTVRRWDPEGRFTSDL
jgi:mannose-6-phosphate isomerase-like protein (cupin superfamily)